MPVPAAEQRLLEHNYQGEHPLRTFFWLYSGQRGRLALTFLCFVLKHSPVWAIPLVVASVIDLVATEGAAATGRLWFYALLLGILLLQNVPTNILHARLLSRAVRTTELQLRTAICRRLQQLSLGYYAHKSPGVLQNKVLRDVETIADMTRTLFSGALAASLSLLVALGTTAIRAPGFLPFFLLTVPAAAALMRMLRGRLAQGNTALRGELEVMSARVTEMTNLIPVTRAHGLEQIALERVGQNLAQVNEAGFRLDMVNALFEALAWITFSAFNAACLIAAAYVYATQLLPISLGDVVLLSTYFGTMTGSVMGLTNILPQITRGFEAIRSIGEVLECTELEHNEGKPAVAQVLGELVFEAVTFVYPEREQPAIEDLSLHVRPGETIALVGPSGSGKSTTLGLLLGFIRPSSGRILLDGADMEAIDMRAFRRFISVVPQDSVLFDGSVRENIAYGLGDADEARLEAALRDANALDFVQKLPSGLDTLIGEKGMRLSGGQKQRLAIARALIRDPRVLVLDEATSSLDTTTEAQIQAALEKLMRGRTTVIAAHRLSTIQNADRIVVIEHGRVREIGRHDELLARGELYAQLYARQAAEDELGEQSVGAERKLKLENIEAS